MLRLLFKNHNPNVSVRSKTIQAISKWVKNAVENVFCSNVASPFPIFNAKKRRVLVCRMLLSNVNIEVNPPTILYMP